MPLLLFLCATVAGAADWRLSPVAGSGPKLYQQDALTDAVEAFLRLDDPVEIPVFGPGAGAGETTTVTRELDLSGEDIASGSDLPYEESPGIFVGLRLETRWSLGPGRAALPSLTGGIGRDTYRLPEGAPPFEDPMSLSFRYLALVPDLTLEQRLAQGRAGEIAGRLSGGAELVAVETRVRSDLLDTRHERRYLHGYAGLGLALRPASMPAELELGARVHDRNTNPNLYWAVVIRF